MIDDYNDNEVVAPGETLYAAASASYMEAQETLEGAKAKAEELLASTREEAAAMMLAAREDIEEDSRAAWQEGFSEGSEEGRRSYDEQLAEKIREDDEMLQRVLGEIHEERERAFAGLEDEVVKLAMGIVKKILNPEEEAVEGTFEMLIKNALKQTVPDGKVIIRVSPAEYERFFASGSAAIELAGGITATASVLRDPSLATGECVIDTENETINAGIDTQLKYIELAFERM